MPFCSYCGTQLVDGVKFCCEYGASVVGPASRKISDSAEAASLNPENSVEPTVATGKATPKKVVLKKAIGGVSAQKVEIKEENVVKCLDTPHG